MWALESRSKHGYPQLIFIVNWEDECELVCHVFFWDSEGKVRLACGDQCVYTTSGTSTHL